MRSTFRNIIFCIILLSALFPGGRNCLAENGYDLWLRYLPLPESATAEAYRQQFRYAVMPVEDPVSQAALEELEKGLLGLLSVRLELKNTVDTGGVLVIGTPETNPLLDTEQFRKKSELLGEEGFSIFSARINSHDCTVLLADKPAGVLYGSFRLLRLIQTGEDPGNPDITESPSVRHRILNHWDNLDRTVERGYAGFSIWDWHRLPEYISQQYIDYARANASVGINGTVLTNVNADSWALKEDYIEKVAALADAFRPWHLKVYLTARFNAPMELDGFATADPLDPEVRKWWKQKVEEIYEKIPDFGGFLVKANSEGQPGPQDYGRSHADGADMLAEALAPYGGIVMWRAFVYSQGVPEDRVRQACDEFVPLDGKFRDNVIIQVKNGPLDFQPREPFHPLFGAMPGTSVGMEFQITQEYLGQGTALCYLAPLWKECLDADTYRKGEHSTVARVVDGSLFGSQNSCIAGVANIGTDRNWCGHPFAQANWYAFGRLAWDHRLSSREIALEWLCMTFSSEPGFLESTVDMMMGSRETIVNYMTPLGLHHIMAAGHHNGPGPWVKKGRPDWTSVYYHRADHLGIGFDRTRSGSNALSQYTEKVSEMYSDPESCPDEYLLWFHHLPWDYRMKSGNTLWDELCIRYFRGVESVGEMQATWKDQEKFIDSERFTQVQQLLELQLKEAERWRDACTLYFRTFSKMPYPGGLKKPACELEEYMKPGYPYGPPSK